MPLVHLLSGTGFASYEDRTLRLRESHVPYATQSDSPQASNDPDAVKYCPLCSTRASTFDLSMKCCLDRYESLFGSVYEHRTRFAQARASALEGDHLPARRLVESYRRVFGPMAAVELKRTLWQSIAEAQAHHAHPRGSIGAGEKSQPAA
jgi:hypothetical protein